MLVAEQVPDPNTALKTVMIIRSPISWSDYLTMPFLLFALVESPFGLRAFLLGGTIGCVILLLSPILFGSGVPPNADSEETEKCDY